MINFGIENRAGKAAMTARVFENWTPASSPCPRCGVLVPSAQTPCPSCQTGQVVTSPVSAVATALQPSPAHADKTSLAWSGYSYPAPRRPARAWPVAVAVLLALITALAGFVIWQRHTRSSAAADPCLSQPPPGAPPAAVAYLKAVANATPGWDKIDHTLLQEQNITHRDDILAQVQVDAIFLRDVQAIHFPAQVAKDAQTFIKALQNYINFMTIAGANHGYLAANAATDFEVNEIRAEASRQLRIDLGIPPAPCSFRRP